MSDPNFWFDKIDFSRRSATSIDTTTLLPKFTQTVVLSQQPCDMFMTTRRVAQTGPSGTVYNVVREPVVKIFPDSETKVPDENDLVKINGDTFRVTRVENFFDGGSHDYRGSRLTLEAVEMTDA